MARKTSWDEIEQVTQPRPLREGRYQVRLEGAKFSTNARGHKCFGIDMVNEWGERALDRLSSEPEHYGFIRAFIQDFLLLDANDYPPDELDKLEGMTFPVKVELYATGPRIERV